MKQMLDIYSDYLLASFSQTSATGLSRLMNGEISHDQVTRFLSSEMKTSKDLWQLVKPYQRKIQSETGVLIIDDSIEEKPYTDENDIICWHWDHSKGRNVKGINFISSMYQNGGVSLPVNFRLVEKTEKYIDKKTRKEKRRSAVSKNELAREMISQVIKNKVEFQFILFDVWFGSKENLVFIKTEMKRDFICPLKRNRKVALSLADKRNGHWQKVETLEIEEDTELEIYLEGVEFPVLLIKQVFTNEDGSNGILYLITSDTTKTKTEIKAIYQRRWNVEEYHKSLKQNVSLAKSPTQTKTTQTNHFFAALCGYIKLEMLKVETKTNHFALKTKLYINALQSAAETLREMNPIQFSA
ncbi:MAG: transposase [Acidobacteriota bacterium]|jgi:hypothetical protein|nr:transposase [Acidobacteriota bacterium]